MRRRKGFFHLVIFIILMSLMLSLIKINTCNHSDEANSYMSIENKDLIRIHIIANSNDKKDQELKYAVRNELVERVKPKIINAKTQKDAMEILIKNQNEIKKIAEKVVFENGFSYPVRVEIGNFLFPARAYGNYVVPAGRYESLRVIIGEGDGNNWWCVLFPPLCFVDISSSEINVDNQVEYKESREALAKVPLQSSLNDEVLLKIRVLDWLRAEKGHLALINT